MQFTIRYEDENDLIVLEASGSIMLADSKMMIDAEIEMLQKYPTASILYDQTGSSANEISSEDIWSISEYSAGLSELLEGKKLAVVLTDDLGYGLGRMWKSFTEVKVPFEINLFRTVAEAREWLSE